MNAHFSLPVSRSVLALLALPCLWLSAAWADEGSIKTPQKASLQFINGRPIRGTLLAISDKEVRFQLDREGTAPAKYKIGSIKAIQTSDGLWVYNKDKGRFENKMPAAKTGARPKTPAEGRQSVVAEGVGADADEALRDAFRAAIRQVVGTLVDSETLVKDDKVISDKVLTYNDGVITKYDKISEKKDNGLVRLKIQAVVERRNLVARLKEFKVFVKEVEGKDVAAEVLTRQEARANASELMQKVLTDLPRILVADARKFNAQDYDEDTKSLRVDVFVKADPDKYKLFLKRLLPLLDKINLNKGGTVVESKPYEGRSARKIGRGKNVEVPVMGGFKSSSAKGFMSQKLPVDQKGWYLWVLTNIDASAVHTRWDVYLIDSDLRKSLAGLNVKASVLVSLHDAEGKIVAEDEVSLTEDTHRWLIHGTRSARDVNICLAP